MAAVLPGYIINNKSIPLNFEEQNFFYNVKFTQIHVNTLNINQRDISFVPGTSQVRLQFGGIDLDSQLDGEITLVGFIPIYAAKIQLKNLTLQANLESIPTDDKVHW